MLLFIILFAIPLMAALMVYQLYRTDLAHMQGERKLKRGAIENLLQRHTNALYVHLAISITTTLIAWYMIGQLSVIILVLWMIVFTGHVHAFSGFSRAVIDVLDDPRISRLLDKMPETSDEQEQEAPQKDYKHTGFRD